MAKKSIKQLVEVDPVASAARRARLQSIVIGFALLIAALLVYTQAG